MQPSIRVRLYESGGSGLALAHMRGMIELIERQTGDVYRGVNTNRMAMAEWLLSYGEPMCERMHFQLVDKYKSLKQGRATNRGRSYGAVNKSNRPIGPQFGDLPDFTTPLGTTNIESKEDKAASQAAGDYVTKQEFGKFGDMVAGSFLQNDRDINNLKQGETSIRGDMKALEHSILVTDAAVKTCMDKINNIKVNTPTIVEIKKPDLPQNISMGIQHRNFPDLLIFCNAILEDNSHLNIWLYGPAGTGKSTAVKNVSKAFGRGFRTNGKISYAHELMGHMHGGEYISTQFREAFEHGHIYCADELDRWLPDAQVALNGALAQNYAAFPDGLIERHPDFVFVGAANTTGMGGTLEYLAAYQPDAAFMDRNVLLDWPIDEALEDHICYNKDWLKYVRKIRKGVNDYRIKSVLVTPRATLYGQALISAGLSLDKTAIAVLKKGMTDAQWSQVNSTN